MAKADTPEATASKPSRLLYWVGALCFAGGIGAAVLMQRGDEAAPSAPNADASSAQSPADIADDKALAAIQNKLVNTLLVPTNFRSVPSFSLTDINGEPVDESLFHDHWSVVFFGFTHCPDVCPITLTVMKEVLAQLATQAESGNQSDGVIPTPQTVFVSVDPKRDTPEILKPYLGFFHPDFKAITGDLNGVHQLSKSLGIATSFTVHEDDPTQYDVDHTASMLLIDPQGRMRAKLSAPHTVDAIVSDYSNILAAIGPSRNAALQ